MAYFFSGWGDTMALLNRVMPTLVTPLFKQIYYIQSKNSENSILSEFSVLLLNIVPDVLLYNAVS